MFLHLHPFLFEVILKVQSTICTHSCGVLHPQIQPDINQKYSEGNSLKVQRVGLCTFTAESPGSVAGWGTKIPHVMWHGPKKKKNALKERATDRKKENIWEKRSRNFKKPNLNLLLAAIYIGLHRIRAFSQVALVVKNLSASAGRHKRHGSNIWVGKVPWRRAWQSTPVFLPGKSHGQRSLMGCSP